MRGSIALILLAGIGFASIAGCGGGGSAPVQRAPSNLVYPQTSVTVVVGQVMTADTPIVTGTVSSYSVSPTLPAGLGINSSTGVISGTPTTVAVQAAYLVTATNGTGSTTATVQITVNPAAPSNLVYVPSTIAAVVGRAITADTPTVTGTVSSYSVSPALPAGLGISSSTGAITGTPTTAVAQAPYVVTATNVTGSTTATVQITVNPAAPSNLVYAPSTITAVVGQAITTDTPTVTGTVSSYSVNPALPAGLGISSSTGAISGTATAVVAQAPYVVTATNVTGSTTATVQITVNPAPPSNLVYPQATIAAFVGQAIMQDVPTYNGTATSFSVSPTLPAGLGIDSTTGILSGTPTVAAAKAAYLVTANGVGSNATFSITLTVTQPPSVLLELGHARQIQQLKLVGNRLASVDDIGHWVLWDYAADAMLASGEGAKPYGVFGNGNSIDMAGSTVSIGMANGLEIHALSDGHLITTISYTQANSGGSNAWGQLASDGSYICIGSITGLYIFTPSGQNTVTVAGDYSIARVFAAPGQVQVANGPSGQNVVQTISTVDGSSTVSAAFSGTFRSWFLDGGRFITALGSTFWVYSNAGVQQSVVSLPSSNNLTGQGNWVWTYDSSSSLGPLSVYAIGSATPTVTYNTGISAVVIPSGTTIGVLADGAGQASVIDLSGSSPTQATYPVPVAYLSAFAASSASQWVVGNEHGALFDGASSTSSPRYFGHGAAWSIAGSSGTAAISTAIGEILVFNPYTLALQESIGFSSSKLNFSSDGSVLAALANTNDAQFEKDRTLNIYSLPSESVIASFPYAVTSGVATPYLVDSSLSASGTIVGKTIFNTNFTATRQVSAVAGGPVIWTDTSSSSTGPLASPILLSPDGTLIGEYPEGAAGVVGTATNIIQNGTLVTAVPGTGVGWIDNNRLLVDEYVMQQPPFSPAYTGSIIYSAAGVSQATPMLPALTSFQTATANSIYSPAMNAVYSLTSTTGTPTWTGTDTSTGVGAVSGAYVVYATGHQVVVEQYQ